MYLDSIKLFTKNEKDLETLIQAVRKGKEDISIEFYIEKGTMLIMKSGKRHMTKGIVLLNQDKIRTFEEMETNKYLGILDTIKYTEMKEKIWKLKPPGNRENPLKPNYVAEISSK